MDAPQIAMKLFIPKAMPSKLIQTPTIPILIPFMQSHAFINFSFDALARQRPRLPLMRELSAKLTEGEILNSQIYIFAHTAKIAINIQITYSDYC